MPVPADGGPYPDLIVSRPCNPSIAALRASFSLNSFDSASLTVSKCHFPSPYGPSRPAPPSAWTTALIAPLAELWSFETSDRFDAGERAALRFAFHAGQHPNAVGDDDLAACREHFDDAQITAIVAVCALFGFLNRWNDTMATTLEDVPRLLADRVLAPQGWDLGRHDGDAEASR